MSRWSGFLRKLIREIGGDRVRHRSDGRQDRRVHRNIGERKHGGTGYRASGPQQMVPIDHAHPREAVPCFLDCVSPSNVDLGEDLSEEQIDLRCGHFGLGELGDVVIVHHRFRDLTKIWGNEGRCETVE